MRSTLIHLLGGVTQEEHDAFVKNLQSLISELKEDKRFYRERVFGDQRRTEAKPSEEKLTGPPNAQPIGRARTPWTILRKRFEQQDREKLASIKDANQQAEEVEKYWTRRNEALNAGAVSEKEI